MCDHEMKSNSNYSAVKEGSCAMTIVVRIACKPKFSRAFFKNLPLLGRRTVATRKLYLTCHYFVCHFHYLYF